MIEIMPESNGSALALKASGTLTDADYKEVLIPKIEEIIKRSVKAKVLLYYPRFYRMGSPCDVGRRQLRTPAQERFREISRVGGAKWVEWATKIAWHFMEGEVKAFGEEQGLRRLWTGFVFDLGFFVRYLRLLRNICKKHKDTYTFMKMVIPSSGRLFLGASTQKPFIHDRQPRGISGFNYNHLRRCLFLNSEWRTTTSGDSMDQDDPRGRSSFFGLQRQDFSMLAARTNAGSLDYVSALSAIPVPAHGQLPSLVSHSAGSHRRWTYENSTTHRVVGGA